jgi:hypothetical protein
MNLATHYILLFLVIIARFYVNSKQNETKNIEVLSSTEENEEEMTLSMKTILAEIRALAVAIQASKQETKALVSMVQETKQDIKKNFNKVVQVFHKTIESLEEMKADTQQEFSRLHFLPDTAKQDLDYSLMYTEEMTKSVHGKSFGGNMSAVLYDSNGVIIIDWNTYTNHDCNIWWPRLLDGLDAWLYNAVLLPGNGILIDLRLERKGSNLLVQTKYSAYQETSNRPSSIKIYFHMKLIIENRDKVSSTIITKKFQQAQITNSLSSIVTILSPAWGKFNPSKLPVLKIHLVAMESNY